VDGIQNTDSTGLGGAGSVSVTDDFTLDGGTAGSATGGTFTDEFAAMTPVTTPEPSSSLQLSVGVLLILGMCFLMKGAKTVSKRAIISILLAAVLTVGSAPLQADHRDAPSTAQDPSANITSLYAFVSYDDPTKVTFIMNVNPFLEPGSGPIFAPFDGGVQYSINIDNNNDAVADISFQFQFVTEIRSASSLVGFSGAGNGINAPANSPPPVAPGTEIIPPAITALDGPGSAGLALRQHYTVTMVKGGKSSTLANEAGGSLFAVPTNVGPRTMPDYPALAEQGIYTLTGGIRVFAGTTDDPFYADSGAQFDTYNFRAVAGGGVLSPASDADDHRNIAPDFFSGYNVNTIAIEVPIAMLTRSAKVLPKTDPAATIGAWATTARPRLLVRRAPLPSQASGSYSQIDRMGNPLITSFFIPLGSRDLWCMSQPASDSQFISSYRDPRLARELNAIFGINIPAPPRNDLLVFLNYVPPIAAPGTPLGPQADLLRLNTGEPPTPAASRRRLGLLAGDPAGFPNGRRVSDDVFDVSYRLIAGIFDGSSFSFRIGDGVNTNDVPFQETFPYVAFAQNGRNRRHIDPGEPGCTMDAGSPCPIN
jgi:hypothetical protein